MCRYVYRHKYVCTNTHVSVLCIYWLFQINFISTKEKFLSSSFYFPISLGESCKFLWKSVAQLKREVDSCRTIFFFEIQQLIEQLVRDDKVICSIQTITLLRIIANATAACNIRRVHKFGDHFNSKLLTYLFYTQRKHFLDMVASNKTIFNEGRTIQWLAPNILWLIKIIICFPMIIAWLIFNHNLLLLQ